MSELRKDPVTARWVIISTDRQKRPQDFVVEPVEPVAVSSCPFCAGNEGATPPEILAWRQNGSPPNGPGWDLRVVPNKFPALRVEGHLERHGEGLFDTMTGIGAHEVIIETPDHGQTLASLPEEAVRRVLWAFRERVVDLKRDIRFRYILIFKNHGAQAGASLSHPHSQLIALPIVPRQVREEIDGAHQHYQYKERCVFCDIVRQELRAGTRVVAENAGIVALEPYAPRLPFETWLLPKRHGSRFEEASEAELDSLARMLKSVLQRMDRALVSPAYNLIVHSSPLPDDISSFYHWHIEIVPKVARVAGFEWGTGLYINPTSPEEAAQVLRDFAPSSA